MNLSLFLEFLNTTDIESYQIPNAFGEQIQFAQEENLDWQEAEVAIIGVLENRKSDTEEIAHTDSIQKVRSELYQLSILSKPCEIIDLGNLRTADTPENTTSRLKEVCEMLIAHDTLPLIIGGAHYLDYGQYMAYENLEKIISVLNVDARIDLEIEGKENTESNHVHNVLVHHPNFLFEYAQLGHQRYLVNPKVLSTLKKLNYDTLSIGQIRDSLKQMEPIIRAADMLTFDLAALKIPYGNNNSTPFGLTGEEAAQICWYAGLNDTLSSAGFYGLEEETTKSSLGKETFAVMLWYFLEGFAHRQAEYSFKSNFHMKYIVALGKDMGDMIFYKSKTTEKWWMEVTVEKGAEERFNRATMIPCSYEDYETATKGIVPDRWIRTVEKFS